MRSPVALPPTQTREFGMDVGTLRISAAQLSTIALDLDDASEALELARKFADETGRTVTVRNEDGETVGIFRGALKN
jgi:hypothetical protein